MITIKCTPNFDGKVEVESVTVGGHQDPEEVKIQPARCVISLSEFAALVRLSGKIFELEVQG